MPVGVLVLFNFKLNEFIIIKPGYFNIRREYRRSKGYLVSLVKDLVLQQARKDIIHGRRAPFGREKVKLPYGSISGKHLLLYVFVDYLLCKCKHPVWCGIMVA